MKIILSWQYCLVLLAFIFLFGQLHEVMHLTAAYLLCGEPGRQVDFNLWTLSDQCAASAYAYLPTLVGPLFSYTMYWTGYVLLRANDSKRWPLGFILVIGNLAFARILTAGMGGGDETTVLKALLMGYPLWLINITGFAVVFIASFPPLYMAYKRLNSKHKLWLTIALCILPLLIMKAYEFTLLGKVLASGFMAHTHFLGIADFIWLHTALMAVIVLLFRKTLFRADANSIT